jgi:signal transduction histidine kinase
MSVRNLLKGSTIVFPLALAATAAMVFISEGSYRQSVATLGDLDAMALARTRVQDLQQSVLDAESGQRGYLLIGREEYLQPYAKALEDIGDAFRSLDVHYAAEPEAQALLARLRAVVETKLSELALTIRLRQEGRREASESIVLTDIGREQMVAIRVLSTDLLQHEARKFAAGRADLYRSLTLARFGVAALSLFSLLALFLYLRQTAALREQQLELKRIVQAERDRLEIEVRQRTAQLTELTQHLLSAREDERQRLARDLHDELGALLTSAKLDAARIRSRLAGSAPEALERLSHLVETLNSSIALGRRIIEDLRPSTLANLGLVATLEILAREFTERSGVKVHCALQPVRLASGAELVVYRVVQEAITNISKYAQASQVWLGMTGADGRVEITIRDDGVGFDPGRRTQSVYGLVGMRFRVEAAGGTLAVESAPGQGSLIRVSLPASAPASAS